jgi:hypothetical protein
MPSAAQMQTFSFPEQAKKNPTFRLTTKINF